MNDSLIPVAVTFTVYKDMGSPKHVLFTVVLSIYFATVILNVSLLLLVYLDTSLHKPMYIFLCSLILNGLLGSTAVWPKVIVILVTDVNTASYQGCLIQVFIVGIYGACNYVMLTVMAYDRFVSIFKPLQYHNIMTPVNVTKLLLVANLSSVVLVCIQMFLTYQIPICKYTVHRLFCDNLAVARLSCGESNVSRISNMYGLCTIILLVGLPILLVLSSYVQIIKLSLQASKQARKKAFETCSPHILIFVNFSLASLFSVIYNRMSPHLPREANILLTVNYILLPPLLHPIIYGIKNQEIRQSVSRIRRRTDFALSEYKFKCKFCHVFIRSLVFCFCIRDSITDCREQ
ncbi:olfactory receptor 52L1-like [Sardina pilchardus]|uniref:olfactory receptor 52L1-like n=1 Tax=Sardina pilchardus TaxID=27697 RepID=UPI002E165A84